MTSVRIELGWISLAMDESKSTPVFCLFEHLINGRIMVTVCKMPNVIETLISMPMMTQHCNYWNVNIEPSPTTTALTMYGADSMPMFHSVLLTNPIFSYKRLFIYSHMLIMRWVDVSDVFKVTIRRVLRRVRFGFVSKIIKGGCWGLTTVAC